MTEKFGVYMYRDRKKAVLVCWGRLYTTVDRCACPLESEIIKKSSKKPPLGARAHRASLEMLF
jgi:hypothetical protein